jgi:hypothetical protein
MARRGFWANISMVLVVILATMGGTASATVYGLKSAADSVDSTAPTFLFKFGSWPILVTQVAKAESPHMRRG